MAALERTYTIHLRKAIITVPEYQKAKKAVNGVVNFIARHMKQPDSNKIIIKPNVNLEIWKHGMRNPPVRVKVNATKNEDGIVTVSLFGAPKEEAPQTEGKKDKKKTELEKKIEEKITPEKPKVEGKAEVKEETEKPKKVKKAEPHSEHDETHHTHEKKTEQHTEHKEPHAEHTNKAEHADHKAAEHHEKKADHKPAKK